MRPLDLFALYKQSLATQFRDRNLTSFFTMHPLPYDNEPSLCDRLKHTLDEIPLFKDCAPESISVFPMKGGSNLSYEVRAFGRKFVLRIRRNAYPMIQQFFRDEGDNILSIEKLQLGIKLRYFNSSNSTLLSDYIENKKTLSPEDFHGVAGDFFLKMFVSMLKSLHRSQITLGNDVNIFEKTRWLCLFLGGEVRKIFHQDEAVFTFISELERTISPFHITLVPCHNDASPGNCLLTDNGLALIDWERSGNNDPAWDLAYLSMSAHLTPVQESRMLTLYDAAKTDYSLTERMTLYKPLVELWKALWLLFLVMDGHERKDYFLKLALEKFESFERLAKLTRDNPIKSVFMFR